MTILLNRSSLPNVSCYPLNQSKPKEWFHLNMNGSGVVRSINARPEAPHPRLLDGGKHFPMKSKASESVHIRIEMYFESKHGNGKKVVEKPLQRFQPPALTVRRSCGLLDPRRLAQIIFIGHSPRRRLGPVRGCLSSFLWHAASTAHHSKDGMGPHTFSWE